MQKTHNYLWRIGWIFTGMILILLVFLLPQKSVRVGYALMDGFQAIGEGEVHSGYNYELLRQIAKDARWKITYVIGEQQDLLEQLQRGEIDVLGGVHEFDFKSRGQVLVANEPSGSDRSILLSKKTPQSTPDFNQWSNATIGHLASDMAKPDLARMAVLDGVKTKLIAYATMDSLLLALESDQVDAITFRSLHRFDQALLIGESELTNFYFVGSPTRSDLMDDINHTMTKVASTPDYLEGLHTHYYLNGSNELFFSSQSDFVFLLLVGSMLLVGLIALFFIFKFSPTRQQDRFLWSLLHAFKNNEMKLSYLPISDITHQNYQMFALLYTWTSQKYGELSKHQMMERKGNRLNFIYRIHEAKLICKEISKLIALDRFRQTRFVIPIHSNYPSLWSVYSLAWIIRFYTFQYHIDTGSLMFSFSSGVVRDDGTKLRIANVFRKMRIAMVMSDFGLEFSSLSQIKKVNYDYFFIDSVYTSDAIDNDVSYQIMKLIVNIANSMGKQTIVDGVDDEKTYRLVKELGCHYIRGAFVGSSLSCDELITNNLSN